MHLPNEWASKITDKNPEVARKAAIHIINNKDMDAWSCLAEHEESMYDFIKEKVAQNLIDAVNENNFNNLFVLMQRYNDWLANIVALAASKFDDININDQMLEYLINGDPDQQAYATRYFVYVDFKPAEKVLIKFLESDNDILKVNAAEALGVKENKNAFEILINKLNSPDDWQKMEAAELLSAYNSPEAVKPILKAMINSSLKENMASEAASIVCLADYLNNDNYELKTLALEAIDSIITGMSEILPLENLITYDFYECIDSLLKLAEGNHSIFSGKYAQILLRAKAKFDILINNEQYTFDESKETKEEIKHINNILTLRDETFWDDMSYLLLEELESQDFNRKANAITTVAEIGLQFAGEKLINVINNENTPEEILCQATYALEELKFVDAIPDLKKLLLRIDDPNRSAIILNTIQILEKEEKASIKN